MGPCKRQCPRQARMHRHCLDSLEIPFPHPCNFSRPPASQILPSTSQDQTPYFQESLPECQNRLYNCQDPDSACPAQPTACQVESPASQLESPAFRIKPSHCQFIPPTCQFRSTSCVNQPIGCQVELSACQLSPPVCQFQSPTSPNRLPYMMKQPICQWDQEFCTVDTTTDCRINRKSSHNICHSYSDDDDSVIMYSDCFGSCMNNEGGCKNIDGNGVDHTYPRDANTSSRTSQNANTTSNYRNADTNSGQTDGNKIQNVINVSRSPRSKQYSQDFNQIPISGGNSPQMLDSSDGYNFRQTLPCCQPGYFQHALQPNFDTENEALVSKNVTLNKSTTRKTSVSVQTEKYLSISHEDEPLELYDSNISPGEKLCEPCCDNCYDKMPNYLTRPYRDNRNDEYQDQQTGPSRDALQGQDKKFNIDDNIYADKYFKKNYRDASKEQVPVQYPRSALKSSSKRPKSSAKMYTQECNGNCKHCENCRDQKSNLQESEHSEFQSEYMKSQTSYADQSDQNVLEISVPIKGPKKFANCCSHGISAVLVNTPEPSENTDAECSKSVACVQKVGTSSCSSTTCNVIKTVSGCGCRYPPAFKQLSCAGNINGTCTCVDKNKADLDEINSMPLTVSSENSSSCFEDGRSNRQTKFSMLIKE